MWLRASVVRSMAGGAAGPRRRDDAEEAHRVHYGQWAPRVQRCKNATWENELQEETYIPLQRGLCPKILNRCFHSRVLLRFNNILNISTFNFYTFMFDISSSSVKCQPRVSCGRITECDTSQIKIFVQFKTTSDEFVQ